MFTWSREKLAGFIVAMVLMPVLSLSTVAAPLTSSLYITGDPTYTSDLAGEFQIYNTTGINFNPGNAWLHPGTFQTFCIEYAINFAPATQYWTQLSNEVAYGGVNNGPKPLAPEVAYLFTKFTKGTLENYTYTPGPGRAADAHELQLALWAIQKDDGAPTVGPGDTKAAAWILDAQNALLSHAWSGLGDVQVLQLWTGAGPGNSFANAGQNQLVLINPGTTTPVPLPKSVWLGLAAIMSLGAFKLVSRKMSSVAISR